jgi:hypothetical protein
MNRKKGRGMKRKTDRKRMTGMKPKERQRDEMKERQR